MEKNQKLIGIAPFAQYDSKVYPSDLMQEVIDQLALDTTNTILLLAVEQKKLKFWIRSANKKNVINMAGKLKLQQELQLISNLDVFRMDSGMHILQPC
jgi:ADP-heptose:LPS heptosyltransferase